DPPDCPSLRGSLRRNELQLQPLRIRYGRMVPCATVGPGRIGTNPHGPGTSGLAVLRGDPAGAWKGRRSAPLENRGGLARWPPTVCSSSHPAPLGAQWEGFLWRNRCRPLPACPAGEGVRRLKGASPHSVFPDPCRLVRQVKEFRG